ncbi:MAG: DUF2608 domain-containing protein [bacterium]
MKSRTVTLFTVTVLTVLLSACVKPDIIHYQVNVKDTNSFSGVQYEIAKLDEQYKPDDVLIVLDIDNTLLTSATDLGGDVWYQWQRGKLDIKPTSTQKVDCLFEDSIGLLYELGPMKLTDQKLPEMIKSWQGSGHPVIALTSRAPKYRAATERELNRNGINFETSAVAAKGKRAPVFRENLKREMSYMKGIMMTTGMNKGKMLSYLLNKTDRHYKWIIFVDDSNKNIKAMSEQFTQLANQNVSIFHFTQVERERIKENGSVLTQSQANKMDSDWKKLNSTLLEIFPARHRQQGCLSL